MSSGTDSSLPNVIWFVVDQMRGQAMSCAADPNVRTPNLDAMAAEGWYLPRALAGSPLCCPARGSMVTGRFPLRSAVAGHQHPLPADARTVAAELDGAGYRTCYVGKWHLDGNRPELGEQTFGEGHARIRMIPPQRRAGFHDWWAYENNNQPFDCLVHTDVGRRPPGSAAIDAEDGMEQFRLDGYETDALTDLSVRWLREHVEQRAGQPLFAVLSVQPPHDPYTAPAGELARRTAEGIRLRDNVPPIDDVRRRAREDLRGYYGAIERIDHCLGRLRAELTRLGLADDTYVLFFSDHGDMLGSHGRWHKTAPWEESIRIPFLAAGPTRATTSGRRDNLITHVDLAPTTLGLCGLPVPEWMDGVDHSSLFGAAEATGQALPTSAYISIPVPTGHRNSIDRPWDGVVTDDGWKYVELDGRPWLMFDLVHDPFEFVNLAHESRHLSTRTRLHEVLTNWRERAGHGIAPHEIHGKDSMPCSTIS